MTSGNPPSEPNLTYPDLTIQYLLDPSPWWIKEDTQDFRRGRLAWAFIPHWGLEPLTLEPTGRTTPTDHRSASYQLRTLRINEPRSKSKLPVAGTPLLDDEVYTVFRAKKRPVLIISAGGEDIPDELKRGRLKWQTQKSILVAPYFGSERSDSRAGWPDDLVERIKRCEYSQYFWDLLPLEKKPTGSILMMNSIQPVGHHYNSLGWTPFRLSDDALVVMEEWILWLVTGKMKENGTLPTFQEILLDYEAGK